MSCGPGTGFGNSPMAADSTGPKLRTMTARMVPHSLVVAALQRAVGSAPHRHNIVGIVEDFNIGARDRAPRPQELAARRQVAAGGRAQKVDPQGDGRDPAADRGGDP